MQKRLVSVALLASMSGCAADLARASSPAIGCAPEEIEVDDVSVGWAETAWSAQCRGMTFHCAGETGTTCSPDRGATGPESTPPR